MLSAMFLCTLSCLACKAPPPALNDTQPLVKIGVLEHRSTIDFKVKGRGSFNSNDGRFRLQGLAGGRWQVEVIDAKPARFEYRLSVGTVTDRFQAEDILRSVRKKGLNGFVKKLSRGKPLDLPQVPKSVYQVLLTESFESQEQAKLYKISIREKTNSEIVRIAATEPQGTLRFTNLDNDYRFDSRETVRLQATEIEIAKVEVGSGFHWESEESRSYRGAIEFVLDADGLITVVNEVRLEEYLKGVVPSEMPAGFPYEALKAQAIASRSEAINKSGLRHPYAPFDLCDDVHCQVFSGTSRAAESTDRAVESTRGIFLLYRGGMAQAFFSGVCGGHTENNENVWLVDARPYLRGILDHSVNRLGNSLQQADNVKKWIDSTPDVYCNLTGSDTPSYLSYAKKYFRWQVTYQRPQLEAILRKQTGENFGSLVDLVPLRRGVSGRIIELEVVGTKKRFVIRHELAIRQALAQNTLFSSCFYVSKKGGRSLPDSFVLHGAGWGHGVGMCQAGAAVMADSGKYFDEILTHYFSGVYLKKLYR